MRWRLQYRLPSESVMLLERDDCGCSQRSRIISHADSYYYAAAEWLTVSVIYHRLGAE